MNPDPLKILEELKSLSGVGFSEVWHVHSFKCYRQPKVGEMQEVDVQILDAGPDVQHGRYSCVAAAEGGRTATGNPDNSIEAVLATVHWYDLDRDVL